MFGLFKKKKDDEDSLYVSTIPQPQPSLEELKQSVDTIETPQKEEDNPPTLIEEKYEPKETNQSIEESYLKSPMEEEIKSLDELIPPSKSETQIPEFPMTSTKSSTLENLCIKIDLEAEDIERKFKEIKTVVSRLNINSPEIFDLLDLYSRAKSRLKNFTEEIDRFDSVGWGIEEETAAFYKFKACKNLSKIRKEMVEIEKLIKESGFTPMKVEEILKTPAEKLVDQLARVSVPHKSPHKLEKSKKKR